MASNYEFKGPVFIIGMPRSGTKLMRAMLNQHPKISLTLAESQCIPYFVRKYGDPPKFNQRAILESFINDFLHTSFFRTMKKIGYDFDMHNFSSCINPLSWSSIFEYVLRHFGSKGQHVDAIWGDKTPGYINHMELIKRIFPKAKFLHMLRDPRDYCLSVKKSWGKNIYRAAQRWNDSVSNACRFGSKLGFDYIEIQYESLLEDPEGSMRKVSTFFGCEYDTKMIEPGRSHEDFGDTRNMYGIIKHNTKKYLKQLSINDIRRIEEIVCHAAVGVGYDLNFAVRYSPLSKLELLMLNIWDGFVSLRHHVRKEHSLARGLRYFVSHYLKSSWR